jgi:hypothetical protein
MPDLNILLDRGPTLQLDRRLAGRLGLAAAGLATCALFFSPSDPLLLQLRRFILISGVGGAMLGIRGGEACGRSRLVDRETAILSDAQDYCDQRETELKEQFQTWQESVFQQAESAYDEIASELEAERERREALQAALEQSQAALDSAAAELNAPQWERGSTIEAYNCNRILHHLATRDPAILCDAARPAAAELGIAEHYYIAPRHPSDLPKLLKPDLIPELEALLDAGVTVRQIGAIIAISRQFQRPTREVQALETERAIQAKRLPELDLAEAIAHDLRHWLLASLTRSGKTWLLRAAILRTHHHHQADFRIIDVKDSHFCGIETDPNRYLNCTELYQIRHVVSRLEAINAERKTRAKLRKQHGGHLPDHIRPLIVILDEFNNLLRLAKRFDQLVRIRTQKHAQESGLDQPEPSHQLLIASFVEDLIFQGAEDRIFVWIAAQSLYVKQICLDTSVQDSLSFVALARRQEYDSIETAYQRADVMGNEGDRDRIRQGISAYQTAVQEGIENPDIPIAYTSLNGHQIIRLPNYQWAVSQVLAPPQNRQSETLTFGTPEQPRDSVSSVSAPPCAPISEPFPILPAAAPPCAPPEPPLSLTRDQRDQILSLLDQGISQRRIIAQVFQIKPGGSSKYQAARATVQLLASQHPSKNSHSSV